MSVDRWQRRAQLTAVLTKKPSRAVRKAAIEAARNAVQNEPHIQRLMAKLAKGRIDESDLQNLPRIKKLMRAGAFLPQMRLAIARDRKRTRPAAEARRAIGNATEELARREAATFRQTEPRLTFEELAMRVAPKIKKSYDQTLRLLKRKPKK